MRSRTWLVALALAGSAAIFLPGCSPRLLGALAPAIFTAAIVGTVMVASYHDAHFHSAECGHPVRFYEGRYVYYYGTQWEYYDPVTGRWYYYNAQ